MPGVPGVAGKTEPPGSGCLPVRLLGSQWAKERQVCTAHCPSLFRRQASGLVSAEKNWKEKISRGERILRRGQASWSDRRNLKWISRRHVSDRRVGARGWTWKNGPREKEGRVLGGGSVSQEACLWRSTTKGKGVFRSEPCEPWTKWELMVELVRRVNGCQETSPSLFPSLSPSTPLFYPVLLSDTIEVVSFMLVTEYPKLNKTRSLPASPGMSALLCPASLSRWFV